MAPQNLAVTVRGEPEGLFFLNTEFAFHTFFAVTGLGAVKSNLPWLVKPHRRALVFT